MDLSGTIITPKIYIKIPQQYPTRLSQEWWDTSAEGQARSWHGEIPDPFKPHSRSPLLEIPGGGSPDICKPDILHVFNLGVGADMALGAIIKAHRYPHVSIMLMADSVSGAPLMANHLSSSTLTYRSSI